MGFLKGSREVEYAERRFSLAEALIRESVSDLRIDCGKGCAYCCYGVTLWVPRIEALALVNFLNKLPLKVRKEIASRLRDYGKRYREEASSVGYDLRSPASESNLDVEKLGLIGGLHMNEVPCPFLNLSDLSCAVYEVRPLLCRLTLFPDREICRKDWENPLSFIWKQEIAPFVDRIKERFFGRWRLKLSELQKSYPELDFGKLEREFIFLGEALRLDPVKKIFKINV